jgi:hypothetical protein
MSHKLTPRNHRIEFYSNSSGVDGVTRVRNGRVWYCDGLFETCLAPHNRTFLSFILRQEWCSKEKALTHRRRSYLDAEVEVSDFEGVKQDQGIYLRIDDCSAVGLFDSTNLYFSKSLCLKRCVS